MDGNARTIPPPPRSAPRTSAMAITSFVLGICSFLFWIFTGLPAIVLGTIALVRINRSNGQLTGNGFAIAGITTGAVSSLLILPIMIALLLPAVQAAREAARRNASMRNMRQIMIAMHNYVDTHGTFPAPGGGAGAGWQLSWRVQILPYLEQQALYEQFHLDEPWDSPHNRGLMAKMPDVFRDPSGSVPPGETPYLVVTGPGMAFEDGAAMPQFRDFVDGTTNTIVLVEADSDQAVEWTKPADWQFNPNIPTRGLGALRHYGFLAAFGDAHIEFIENDTGPEVTKAMMTRAGREPMPR